MTVDVHNPDQTESKPLTTELETLAPEATAEQAELSSEITSTTQEPVEEAAQPLASAAASSSDGSASSSEETGPDATEEASATNAEPDYDAADFAAALANFDREQAAETAAAANLTAEEAVVTGTVVKITDKHVVIDIGLKSEGLIPIEQVLDHEGKPKFNAGDAIDVVVEREEPEGGYLVSYEKALRHKIWDKLEKAANDKTPVKGMVVSRVKGGLTVDIGIKAFLPGSQIEVRPVRNLDGYIGTEIEVRVIKLNKKRGNVVISRKEILEEEQNAKKAVTLAHLEEGSVLTGTVKNLTDYGAFVDLGGLDGLLHITDMSWGRLTHPRDLVNVGDEIQVKVLKFDKEKQRVSLGFKQLTPDPWLDATERYPIGAQVRGRVLSVTDYGAFVELEQGIEGLVHVSEMTWSKRMKHPSKMVKPGDEVDTIILEREPQRPAHLAGHEATAGQSLGATGEQVPDRRDRRGAGAQPDGLRRVHRDRGRHRRAGACVEPELDQAHQAPVGGAEEGREGAGDRSGRGAGEPAALAGGEAVAAGRLGDVLRAAPRSAT